MAVNLPPQYHDAEAEYKKARTPEEKLAALRKMWVILPKHKASEKVQVILKTKISEISDEVEDTVKARRRRRRLAIRTVRLGVPAQIVFLGGPNGGRSSMRPQADKGDARGCPLSIRTTREPVPGMMEWEDVRVQLIDLPPITADFYRALCHRLCSHGGCGDILVVDLGDDDGPFAAETALERLAGRREFSLSGTSPPEAARRIRTIFHVRIGCSVANKVDAEGGKRSPRHLEGDDRHADADLYPCPPRVAMESTNPVNTALPVTGMGGIRRQSAGKPADKTTRSRSRSAVRYSTSRRKFTRT